METDLKDNPQKHWYPSEGWAIFFNWDKGVNEVQRIDELNMLLSDDAAISLARRRGYMVGSQDNPYEVFNVKL